MGAGNGQGLHTIRHILIDLAPILLGSGVRLLDHLGVGPIDLEKIVVVDAPDVTHLKFRVIK